MDDLGETRRDLLDLLDSAYAVERPRSEWLAGLSASAAATLDRGAGLAVLLYDISSGKLRIEALAARGLSDAWQKAAGSVHTSPRNATAFALIYRASTCASASELLERAGVHGYQEAMRSCGLVDQLVINGGDPSGHGCVVHVPCVEKLDRGSADETLGRIGAHLATAYRLQRRLTGKDGGAVEAVLDSEGRVHHAEEPAKARSTLASLSEATRRREWARGRKSDATGAVKGWSGMVAARWTLVDSFESDGKRYVVARENRVRPTGISALSEREGQVASLAALGRSNKLIAYELGLAHSTVRVLLTRAAAKLGVRSRHELIERMSVPPAEGSPSPR